jgi:hypothetical protein
VTPLEIKARDLFVALGSEGGDRFELGSAHFWAVKRNGSHRLITTHADVYEGCENLPLSFVLAEGDEAIALETCGWASPLDDNDDDIAPSQHPKRRRVRLLALITRRFEMASALGFADDADEIVTDAGQAVGTLADALAGTMRLLVNQSN